MSTTLLVLRTIHISMGMLALLSGAGALIFSKGSRLHQRSGTVFFASMLVMSSSGAYIAGFLRPNAGNVMGGALTFYLTATGWATVWRKPATSGRLELVLALLGVAVAIAGLSFGLKAAASPGGRFHLYPAIFYYIFGGAALLGALLDVRMLVRGGFSGASRLTRHLTRMCLAMFMATASFFLGQAKLFPAGVRESGVLRIPVLLVIGALLYWLIRIRVWPPMRRAWSSRVASRA